MYLNLKSEYSFGKVFAHLDQLADHCSKYSKWAGLADIDGTWGHVKWEKACKKYDIKPIYGVSLRAFSEEDMKVRRCRQAEFFLIALTGKGLSELYQIVDIAHQQFYYIPRIAYSQLNQLSNSIALIAGPGVETEKLKRHSYKRICPGDPIRWQRDCKLDPIACIDNNYINPEDKIVYEPFAEERKLERKTSPQFILRYDQWISFFPGMELAIENMNIIAEYATAKLKVAPKLRYTEKLNLKKLCEEGEIKRGIDLNKEVYKQRLERELSVIKEKDFEDYFFIVADLIKYARTKMVVGPSRGSSAGSLVCYLLHITEVDPIPYDLYFERFIDINRLDLPDIDIDFQDNKRDLAIKYLQKKYGIKNVAQIGNVNRLKPKSALTRFAKSLILPLNEVDNIKEAIPERLGGDSRAKMCIMDTFNETKPGKDFIKKYPNIKVVEKIEGHASHTGVHAAGVLVCNDAIDKYCGINSRDKKTKIAMVDKKDIEKINLIKIDILGLRTLTIFAEVCDTLKKPYSWLYEIPLNDESTYKVFNDHRFSNIFQFEGGATTGLAIQMEIKNIEDISALTALSRPGPLISGSSDEYISRANGKKEIEYITNHPIIKEATKITYGVIVYQEQVLKLSREYGGLSWKDTSILRNVMSKSLGKEFFDKYKKDFLKGAIKRGEKEEDAIKVWEHINTYGSYGFNKSHSVSYGWISYICAYLKAHYPMEFAVACLNNSKDDSSALKLLRDLWETENIKYVPFDINKSKEKWSAQDGILYGGLTTLHGIGPANAKKIIKLRKENKSFPKGIQKNIDKCDTPFKYLYPAKEQFGNMYNNPEKYNLSREISLIKDVKESGKYIFIGCLIRKNLTDANDVAMVARRNGNFLKGPTTYLKFWIEDDTDIIACNIDRFIYPKIGEDIAENGKENKDLYLIYGKIQNNFRVLKVLNIKRITKE